MENIENKNTLVETNKKEEKNIDLNQYEKNILENKELAKLQEKQDPENQNMEEDLTNNMLAQIDAANNETIINQDLWENIAAVRTSAWIKWTKQAWNNLKDFFS